MSTGRSQPAISTVITYDLTGDHAAFRSEMEARGWSYGDKANPFPGRVCKKGPSVHECGQFASLALDDLKAAERAVHPRGRLKRWYIAAQAGGSHSTWGGDET